jgi:hypothetical protein
MSSVTNAAELIEENIDEEIDKKPIIKVAKLLGFKEKMECIKNNDLSDILKELKELKIKFKEAKKALGDLNGSADK